MNKEGNEVTDSSSSGSILADSSFDIVNAFDIVQPAGIGHKSSNQTLYHM